MPFNNGDLMSMQGALIDQRLRFAHSGQAQRLTKNASILEVEIVDPATVRDLFRIESSRPTLCGRLMCMITGRMRLMATRMWRLTRAQAQTGSGPT